MRRLFYNISIVIFLLSKTVFAEFDSYDVFDLVNNSFYTGFTLMHFNYKENAREINPVYPVDVSHKGISYGVGINIRNVFLKRLYADLMGEFTTGKITYDGCRLYPPYSLIKRKQTNNFSNADLKLGFILFDSKYFQVIPYGGFGFRYWSIDTASSYEYYNFKAIAGGKINYMLVKDLVLSPYFNFGTTFGGHAKTKAYAANGTFLGNADFVLGNKPIYDFGLEINYRLESELFVTGMINYTAFKYGKSNVQYEFIEPNSRTNEIRLRIGIRYGFV